MIHAFLDFELDETLFELRQNGKPLEVQARVFATLLCLVRNRGRIISRDELTQSVWKDTVVSDTAISQVVMLARKALGDGGMNPQIIRTIRGRGFRFAPPVTVHEHSPEPVPVPDVQQPIAAELPTQAPAAISGDGGFVGRTEELARILQCLERAGRGRGGLVLVEGESGSGRSSLVRELSRRAAIRGVQTAWGRSWETQTAPPFWPWTSVLRELVQHHGLERLRGLSGEYGNDLALVFPELATKASALQVDAANIQVRFRVFAALSRLLRAVSLESGSALLVVLEDIQSADEASLQLLRYLSEEISDMPVLILLTLDQLAPGVSEHLTQLLPWTAPHLHRLRLSGLSPSELASWIERELGAPAPADLAHGLYQLSAGNPALAHAWLKRLEQQPDSAGGSAWDPASYPLPERITSAVLRHLAELPEATLRALSAAAVLGCEFPIPWLSAVLEQTEAELLEALAPALRRSVLRANSPKFGVWAFMHALVRSALYGLLPVSERFELHRRVATLIEPSAGTDPLRLRELAHHYLLAGPGPTRDKAIAFGEEAAAQCERALLHEPAAQLYDRAADLLDVSLPAQPARHYQLLMAAGHAWHRAGQLERASVRFARAAALSGGEGDRHVQALCMAALMTRGTLLFDAVAQARFAQALIGAAPGPNRQRALLMAAAGLGLRARRERDGQTEAAVRMARELSDKHTLAFTLHARHCALWGVAAPEELLALASEMIELARELKNDELLLDGQLWRMVDHIELGQLAQALQDHREYADVAKPSHSAYHNYMLLTLEAAEAASGGQFERAQDLSESARSVGKRMRESSSEAFYEVRQLFLQLEPTLGAASESTQPAVRGPYLEPPSCVPADYHAFWALSWVRNGHDEQARTLLDDLSADDFELRAVPDALRKPIWAVLARVSVRLRHRGSAELLYARLSPHAARHLLLQAGVYLGPVSYYLGILAALLDQNADAAGHFEHALQASQRSLTFLARTQFEYAQLLARGPGARRRAEQLLREAEVNARQLGSREVVEPLNTPFDPTRLPTRASYA